ncbi:protein phosphatase 1 regulatory subunit 14C-like [Pollicipes pollicipes]|uniref:protein phosphatase 1 regulatory subunit 14C-like n=1 Tax=Pollicipes pollicipes TaxID=41117 RepID=UPI0018858D3F|nr:protein phosphatase 1 regulatory subunit 14C-like [Pollicipes pollicipes]
MEVGIPAGYSPTSKGTDNMLENKAIKSPKAVNFEPAHGRMDSRKKYLTAKYGSHQMALIRKRLSVEMWVLEEMAKLYGPQTGDQAAAHQELDLDELLDIDGTAERRSYLRRLLADASAPPRQQLHAFIEELLAQADKL